MGCGGSREKETGVHAHLDHWMATIGIEDVDKTFADASKLIQSVEEMRVIVVDNRDALVISSGACSYAEPKFSDCFMGIAWKLSADNEGKFLDAGLKMGQGDFNLEGKKNSAEGKKAFEDFVAYVKGGMAVRSNLEDVTQTGKEMATRFAEKAAELTTQVTEHFKEKPLQLPGKLKDLKANIDKCINATTCVAKLVEELTNTLNFFNDVHKIFEDASKIDEVGLKAHKAKQVKAHEITFASIADPKMRHGKKADDGLQFWMRRTEQKKATKDAHAKKK